jgi:hypothetical protein
MGIGADYGDPVPPAGKLSEAEQDCHMRMSAADYNEALCHVSPP